MLKKAATPNKLNCQALAQKKCGLLVEEKLQEIRRYLKNQSKGQ